MLKPGQPAPDVAFVALDGSQIDLTAFRGKPLVLFFYPKDNTVGCTIEACTFRDAYQDFVDAGAEVVGVSNDDPASHRQFIEKSRLPFRLLSDTGGRGRAAFGVPSTLGVIPGRATFVIDADGTILHAFNSQFMLAQHVTRALAALATTKA
jgi:thioredoxin-dependent peroxiredoxin